MGNASDLRVELHSDRSDPGIDHGAVFRGKELVMNPQRCDREGVVDGPGIAVVGIEKWRFGVFEGGRQSGTFGLKAYGQVGWSRCRSLRSKRLALEVGQPSVVEYTELRLEMRIEWGDPGLGFECSQCLVAAF